MMMIVMTVVAFVIIAVFVVKAKSRKSLTGLTDTKLLNVWITPR